MNLNKFTFSTAFQFSIRSRRFESYTAYMVTVETATLNGGPVFEVGSLSLAVSICRNLISLVIGPSR